MKSLTNLKLIFYVINFLPRLPSLHINKLWKCIRYHVIDTRTYCVKKLPFALKTDDCFLPSVEKILLMKSGANDFP